MMTQHSDDPVDAMNHHTQPRSPVFAELSTVRLSADVSVGDRRLPAGTRGAVVYVYRGGEAYEVEFVEPFAAVLTLEPAQLSL